MNVTWLVFADVPGAARGYYSPLASLRLRVLIPADALKALGHGVQVLRLRHDDDAREIVPQISGDVVIFSKIMGPDAQTLHRHFTLALHVARSVQQGGRSVIVDVCDDLFPVPEYGDCLKALTGLADLVATSSSQMAEVARSHTDRTIQVVGEPFEGDRGEIRFAPPRSRARSLLGKVLDSVALGGASPRALKLTWFGHGTNLPAVLELLPELERLADRHVLELNLITSAGSGVDELCASFNNRHGLRFTLRFTPWSPEATQHGLEACDLVVIPTRLADPTKLVKSSNRLVQSLWSGRFVVAHPVDSYLPFERYSWIGTDLIAGVQWALSNPGEVRCRIAAGQEHVARRHGPRAVASQWEAAIEAARAARS